MYLLYFVCKQTILVRQRFMEEMDWAKSVDSHVDAKPYG